MFLIDDLLLLPLRIPVSGFNWIMKQIQTMANEELLNDQPWKERLIELQMMLEVGDITEEEYGREEAQVFAALRDIRARREEIARQMAAERDEDDGGIGIYTGYGQCRSRRPSTNWPAAASSSSAARAASARPLSPSPRRCTWRKAGARSSSLPPTPLRTSAICSMEKFARRR